MVFHDLRGEGSLLSKAHIGRKGGMGHPFGGGSGGALLEHAVDLLEGEALGFWDEEEGVDEAGEAERAPDEEDFGAEVAFGGADHVGCDDCDDL